MRLSLWKRVCGNQRSMNLGDPKNLDPVTRIFTETNLPCCWMWNMRSPPFRYSITKNRCDWKRKKIEKYYPSRWGWSNYRIREKTGPRSRLSGRCRRGDRGRGASPPGPKLSARSWYTRCHRPPALHLSSAPGHQSLVHMMRFQDQVADLDCIVVLTASQLCQQNFAKAGERGGDQVGEDGRGWLTFPFLTLGGIWSPSLHTSWKTDDTLWAPRFSDSWISLPFHHHQNRSSRPAVPETDFWRNRWNLREKAVRERAWTSI